MMFTTAMMMGSTPTWRFWRINVTSTGTTSCQVGELQFRSSVGGSDETTPGEAGSRAFPSGNSSSPNAFDDDVSTHYFEGSFPAVLGWEFAEGIDIKEIAITSNTGSGYTRSPEDFEIQGSEDGSNYTTVKTVTGEPEWSEGETRVYTI